MPCSATGPAIDPIDRRAAAVPAAPWPWPEGRSLLDRDDIAADLERGDPEDLRVAFDALAPGTAPVPPRV